ncbi:unnamed protein product, partial [Prorocentrum cordatum]
LLLLPRAALRALQGAVPGVLPVRGARPGALGRGAQMRGALRGSREHDARRPAARRVQSSRMQCSWCAAPSGESPPMEPGPPRALAGGRQARHDGPRPRQQRVHCRRVDITMPCHDSLQRGQLHPGGQQFQVRHAGFDEEAPSAGCGRAALHPGWPNCPQYFGRAGAAGDCAGGCVPALRGRALDGGEQCSCLSEELRTACVTHPL